METQSAPAMNKMKESTEKMMADNGSFQDGVVSGDRKEGQVTKQIESVTSKLPSGMFLGIAFGSIGLSALLQMMGRKADAQFIGQWVPTVLILGLYNKLVKLEGSE
jgi:hypothetical protein